MPDRSTSELERDVDALALKQGRVVGTDGHAAARHYLAGRLEQLGLRPYRGDSYDLRYRVGRMQGHNLIGVLPGSRREVAPLLLGAHYDSPIAAPCADDNAAAVAILLRIARRLGSRAVMGRDVIFALFDAEEPPHYECETMGSIRFWEDQADTRGIHCAVIQDLTGHDVQVDSLLPSNAPLAALTRVRNLIFMTGAESHPRLGDRVLAARDGNPLGLVAVLNRYVGDMSDHGIFRRNGVPYLFFSCGRWQHYHQPTDTPDRLSYPKMAWIADLLERLALELADADLGVSSGDVDTTALEIRTLREALGDLLPEVCRLHGIRYPKNRGDLADFARHLQALGL